MPVPVGREELSREVRERHQRDRVLDAATAVFAKRGYLGATVDHIIASAGIGVGSFYQLFDGKEDCFQQAYDRVVSDARERLRKEVPADGTPATQVCMGLRLLVDMLRADPLRTRLALAEVQAAGPNAVARHQENLDEAIPSLLGCRRESRFGDELPASLEHAIVGGVAWLLHHRLVTGDLGRDDLFPELAGIVLGPYFGEAEAARLAGAC